MSESIRARYLECLARASYENVRSDLPETNPEPWEKLPDNLRAPFLAGEEMYVDALEAAGLIPPVQQWGVRYEHWDSLLGRHVTKTLTVLDEGHARQAVEAERPEGEDHRLVSRYIADWVEEDE